MRGAPAKYGSVGGSGDVDKHLEDGALDQRGDLPELTAKALILGCLLSVVLGAANAYLGLKIGMTVSASIPASVVSMAVLSCFKSHTILENNQVQTAAASGPAVAAGAIFTIPALLMLNYWQSIKYFQTLGIVLVGGFLGILCTIPLRRAFVVASSASELRFPEGVATATVLEVGATSGSGKTQDLRVLLASSAYAAMCKVLGQGLGFWDEKVTHAWHAGRTILFIGSDLSVALVGVGYIVGLRICALTFLGGLINWWVAIPLELMTNIGTYSAEFGLRAPAEIAVEVWSTKTRYMGVGAMLVGGLWALISVRSELADGVVKAFRSMRWSHEESDLSRLEQDLPGSTTLPLLLLCAIGFVASGVAVAQHFSAVVTCVVLLFGAFLFSALAAYMAGLVGSSQSPTSGIAIASILVAALLFHLSLDSRHTMEGMAASIVVGAIVCGAASIGGDNMQDLKCGRLVGATPWKQQVSQLVGVCVGTLFLPIVIQLLYAAYGFQGAAGGHSNPLPAPQAGLMEAVVRGMFQGSLPWSWVGAGVALGVLVIALDAYLDYLKSGIRCPVLAVAMGVYLPWGLTVPMMLGGLVAYIMAGGQSSGDTTAAHRGLVASSGLITGEALLGIVLAIPVVVTQREEVFHLGFSSPWLGLASVLAAVVGLAAVSLSAGDQDDLAAAAQ